MKKIQKILSDLRFAVILIIIFSLMMTIGTLVESSSGTEYANRLIYKSWPFFLLQILMFCSVTAATLVRLPAKRRLYGFYVLHLGILITFIGSFLTYFSGIDGNITLYPNETARKVVLQDDQLSIGYEDDEKEVLYTLPNAILSKNLSAKWKDIEIQKYLPYATKELRWIESEKQFQSAKYRIANENVAQEVILSTHPKSFDFPPSTKIGLLNLHFLPPDLLKCFKTQNKSGLFLWDTQNEQCRPFEEFNVPLKTTTSKKRFFAIPFPNEVLAFFPDVSPWPYTGDQVMRTSRWRVFNKKLFEESPHLFLFGDHVAYYDDEWVTHKIKKEGVELPWMNFKATLIQHETNKYPLWWPVPKRPIQENGKIVEGGLRAVYIKVLDQKFWVTTEDPISLRIKGQKVNFQLKKKTWGLPFEITLTKFKMNQDPGTKTPASYESFVSVLTSRGGKKHHIFMNNPLKKGRLTFYQASYFQTKQGYGSVLSVNFDPGRPVKYFGLLLLVLGSIAHYFINQKRTRP